MAATANTANTANEDSANDGEDRAPDDRVGGGLRSWFRKHSLGIVLWTVGAIAAAIIGFLVLIPIENIRLGNDAATKGRRYVALIMSNADPSFTIPQEFRRGFESNGIELKARDGSALNFVFRDDNYSPEDASKLATDLVDDPNCVLIVGSSNSELTRVTLQAILAQPKEKRPAFIMPIATANSLIKLAEDGEYRAILRMVPSNKNQSERIRRFVIGKGKSDRIAILVDEQNREYSEDLAYSLSADIQKNGGHVVYRGTYGDSARLSNVAEFLRSQQPDYIVFVGVSNNGLMLVDDMVANRLSVPILFTDGGTVGDLIERASHLSGGAYFLSSVKTRKNEPTYNPIGIDARSLIAKILSTAADTHRETIRDRIENHRALFEGDGEAGAYNFNAKGENEGMEFEIYKVTPSGLERQGGY